MKIDPVIFGSRDIFLEKPKRIHYDKDIHETLRREA